MSRHSSFADGSPSRRAFLAAGGTAVLTATAGCTAVVDFLGNQLLDQVNVFNETARRVGGSITVVDPDGEAVLDTTFDLAAGESEDGESTATYGDVWDGAGSYEATVELDTEIAGESSASESVAIENPDEEMLAVALGSTEVGDPIAFRVGTSLSAFAAGNSSSEASADGDERSE